MLKKLVKTLSFTAQISCSSIFASLTLTAVNSKRKQHYRRPREHPRNTSDTSFIVEKNDHEVL
jgi:hypothetical protein